MTHDSQELDEQLQREMNTLTLREIVRVPVHASLREVAHRLRESDVSSALVGDEQLEIVTERDLTRALAEGHSPNDPVESIAERIPIWVTTTSQVADVAWMMLEYDVRHLIVLAPDGKAVGVVSMRDIFSLLVPGLPPLRS